jgi:hypothetical protein
MEKYLGVKLISAEPMLRSIGINEGLVRINSTDPSILDQEGYKIIYEGDGKGYTSWSPKEVFEKAYRRIDNLTFGLAIEALKLGKKITRSGWNGKGMFLFYLPAGNISVKIMSDPALIKIAEDNGGNIECLPSIRMKNADNKLLTGWLASMTDIFAEDWMIIE